jgi:hypothetical protein
VNSNGLQFMEQVGTSKIEIKMGQFALALGLPSTTYTVSPVRM